MWMINDLRRDERDLQGSTGRCSYDFFRGGSKVNHNIGNHDFWINNLKIARPQDVVASDNEQNGKFNHARMGY